MTLTAEYKTRSGKVMTVIGEAASRPKSPRMPYVRTNEAAVKPATKPFLITIPPVTRKPRRKKKPRSAIKKFWKRHSGKTSRTAKSVNRETGRNRKGRMP